MAIRSNTLVLALAAIVVAGTLAGLTIGVHRSHAPEHRPPPVRLTDALLAHRAETEDLLRVGKFAEAEVYLQRVLPLVRSDLHEYHQLMGRALMGQPGRLDEAVEQFRFALQMEPRFPEAHNSLATAYARRGETALAVMEAKAALEVDPSYEPARLNLASIRASEEGPAPPPATRGEAPGGEGLDLARGRVYSRQFHRGQLDDLHASFTDLLAAEMPVEALSAMQRETTARLGREVELIGERIVPEPDSRLYVRTARYERHDGEIDFVVRLNPDRSVAGLQVRAAISDPPR